MTRIIKTTVIFLIYMSMTAPNSFPDSWYGFSNDTTQQDREKELRQKCGPFSRKEVPLNGSSDNVRFSALCSHIGMTCVSVCDWQGRTKSCDEAPTTTNGYYYRDGSRIALCRGDSPKPPPVQTDKHGMLITYTSGIGDFGLDGSVSVTNKSNGKNGTEKLEKGITAAQCATRTLTACKKANIECNLSGFYGINIYGNDNIVTVVGATMTKTDF